MAPYETRRLALAPADVKLDVG